MNDTKSNAATASTAGASAEESSRRDILGKLFGVLAGGVALQTLAACAQTDGGVAENDALGEAAEAIGALSSIWWADTVTDIRALGGAQYPLAAMKGWYAPGDGGGGLFYWSSVAAPDDGGTVLNLGASNSAGWRRIHSGPLNVRWFGARGDASADDDAAIQKALDVAMANGGGTVLVPPGTYRVANAVRVPDRVTLAGSGSASVLKKVSSQHPLEQFNAVQNYGADVPSGCVTVWEGSGNSDVTIRDLVIDGSKVDAFFHCECTTGHGLCFHDCTNLRVEHCEVRNCTNDGIVVQWGDSATISGCYLHDNNKAGIYLSGAERVAVLGNVCESNLSAVSVACSWHCTVQGNVTRNNIQTNVSTSCGGPGVLGGGILIGRDSRFCAIVGNATESILTVPEVMSGSRHGVNYSGDVFLGASSCVIANNTVRNKAGDSCAISLAEGSGNVVTGNVVESPTQYGIVLNGAADNKILGNRIHDGGPGWAILVQSTYATPAIGNVIESNDMTDDRATQVMGGVLLQNLANLPAVTDNTVRFNQSNLVAQSFSIAPNNPEYGNTSGAGPRLWQVAGGLALGGGPLISRHLSVQASVSWNPTNPLQPAQHAYTFVSVPGAAVGDTVSVGIQLSIAGVLASGTVASAGSVMVSVYNPPSSGFQQQLPPTLRVDVWQH